MSAQATAREKILQKILKLRARAEDDASSETEMNVAFSMAAKLMDAYGVEEAELALAESEGRITLDVINKVIDTSALKGKQRHKVILTLTSVAEFTSTKVVYSPQTGDITFTGHRPDVELANYLVAIIREAMDREYESYRKANIAVGYGAKSSFQISMANRVSNRLFTMAMEAKKHREDNKKQAEDLKQIEHAGVSNRTALVVCAIAEQKRKEVDALFAKTHTSLRKSAGFSYGRNTSAHSAGDAAGRRIHLGHSLSNSNKSSLPA